MMKRLLLAILIFLMAGSLLLAQRGESSEEEAVEPETTVFYFGQNLEGDVLMVESIARFDTRAPLGTVVGMINGITGEVEIWLDSVMLMEDLQEAQEVETEMEAGEETPAEEAPEAEAMAEEAAEEPAESEEEPLEEAEPEVIPPSGYMHPTANFEIPLRNLKTTSPVRDELLKSEAYLDVANYPTAIFTLVNTSDPSAFHLRNGQEISLTAVCDLTLHGVTKRYGNIEVYITYIEEKPITRQNTQMTGNLLHMMAELDIKLSDFEIFIPDEDLLTLDDKVKITVDLFGSTVQ